MRKCISYVSLLFHANIMQNRDPFLVTAVINYLYEYNVFIFCLEIYGKTTVFKTLHLHITSMSPSISYGNLLLIHSSIIIETDGTEIYPPRLLID